MFRLEFEVQGPPTAKAKKIGAVRSKGADGVIRARAIGYNDRKTGAYQGAVRAAAEAAAAREGWLRPPSRGLVSLRVIAVFERPAYMSIRNKNGTLSGGYSGGREPFARKPDLDNLYKSIQDGLTHAGIYDDDVQVRDHDGSRRYYAAICEDPHTEITVTWIDAIVEASDGAGA